MRTHLRSLHPRTPEGGFSIVEGLIAAGLLLLIAVGVLPLFTQAIRNNFSGERTSQASSLARSTLETYYRIPFSDTAMTVGDGLTSEVTEDFWASSTSTDGPPYAWYDTLDTAGTQRASWTRTITVRQYGMLQISSFDPLAVLVVPSPTVTGDPIPGGAGTSAYVYSKSVEIELEGGDAGSTDASLLLNRRNGQHLTAVRLY